MPARHAGAARWAYNFALEQRTHHYNETGESISHIDVNRELVQLKKQKQTHGKSTIMPTRETKQIRRWMYNELNSAAEEYFAYGEPQYTKLAEQAAWALDPEDVWLDDPDHEVWDLAVDVLDEYVADVLRGAHTRSAAPQPVTRDDFTDMLIGWIEWGRNLAMSDPAYVETVREILEARDPQQIKDLVIDYVVYGPYSDLPSPFRNFILLGLNENIDWDYVADYVADQLDYMNEQ